MEARQGDRNQTRCNVAEGNLFEGASKAGTVAGIKAGRWDCV